MIPRLKDPTIQHHDPGDENDWNPADSILVDTLVYMNPLGKQPPWKIDLMLKTFARMCARP